MTKVVKLPLICEQSDKDGNSIDYKKIYEILFELQRQTREIKINLYSIVGSLVIFQVIIISKIMNILKKKTSYHIRW